MTEAGWLARLKTGLARSSERLSEGINRIFVRQKLDQAALDQLEEALIAADLGPVTAAKVAAELARDRFDQNVSPAEVKRTLVRQITKVLEPVAQPLDIEQGFKPHVILVVGVNGSGKTTTIGKYAHFMREEAGLKVMLAAGDTFRAAAIEQLQVWGDRAGCPVITRPQGSDPSGLVFDAMAQAKREEYDILLIDTAGRLQNKSGLMAELQKVVRVIEKQEITAPHHTLLVLDATTGQNAHSQVQTFREMVNVNGLIVTKLDGTAKGGVLVSLAERFKVPVHAIGIGERADDLRPFDAEEFAKGLVGVDD